jgi:hypothetical protein
MTGGNFRPKGAGPPVRRMTVTLYDLIAAVNDSIEPGEEKLVGDIVIGLLRRNRAKYLRRVPGARGPWPNPKPRHRFRLEPMSRLIQRSR